MRINQYIAAAGITSRRKADELSGKVFDGSMEIPEAAKQMREIITQALDK